MHILIIKISSMGDIIHTLPAITDASNLIPTISFDWVIEESFSEIPTWHPSIHQIIPIKLRSWKNQWYKPNTWKKYYEFIKQLNTHKYNKIIDAQGLLKTSLFITSNIINGIKHGMNSLSAKEPISCWCYDHHHHIPKNQHAIERIRQLFSYSLQYPIPTYPGQYNINHHFNNSSIRTPSKPPYLIFFHTTSQSKKEWPKLNWHILTQHAINTGYHIKVPFWTKQEKLNTKQLKNHFQQITILPNLTLKKIAHQINKATATISVDTGLSHLSAALNCPNLTLYGPTNPKLIGTYGKNQFFLHSSTKEMKDIHPNHVWKIFKEKILNNPK